MRYYVTGNKGFVGNCLMKSLSNLSLDAVGLGDSGNDISDTHYFDNLIPNEGDVLIHLANKSFVPESWVETHRYFDVNLMGTINALDFCKKHKLNIVYVSSYLYGDPDYFPIDELHQVKVNNPYALSKKLCEEVIEFYGRSFDINYSILRPFNIYGPNQKENFIIPILMKQLLDESINEVTIQDARPKRDFIHVQDLVDAIILATKNLNGQIYNICSGSSINLEELYGLILKISLKNKKLVDLQNHRKNEIMDCYGSFEKFRKDTGWQPKISLMDGLKECLQTSI
ncbi:MAG: NAD(P)-dependent oxidoreductase [Bacteroidia bacterium]|nr:NAD(P)-dependent oxidoreductase [Bacteroidia bacterium]